jgi:rod shape-determining protein MreC
MLSATVNFIKNKKLAPILVAFCTSAILIILPENAKIAVSRAFINSLYSPFLQIDKFLTDVADARRENVEINKQLIDYSIQAANYIEDHHENIRLRRMLNFDLQIPYRLVPAEVTGINSGSLLRSIVINTGKSHGIGVNKPIVTADGIVGKTINVTNNAAVVQLLYDHNCRVSAIDQNTRAMGIVRWQGGKLLEMGDVPIESDIAVGDTVVSTGLGGIFPPGLKIGIVVFVRNPEGTLFKHVMIKPLVNFDSLEEVFVIIIDE